MEYEPLNYSGQREICSLKCLSLVQTYCSEWHWSIVQTYRLRSYLFFIQTYLEVFVFCINLLLLEKSKESSFSLVSEWESLIKRHVHEKWKMTERTEYILFEYFCFVFFFY